MKKQPKTSLRLARIAATASVLVSALTFASAPLRAQATPAWPDSYVARLEALALIQTLNAELLGSRSATITLEGWCRNHRLAPEPRIVAERMIGTDKTPTPEQRQRLQIGDGDTVKYRRVQLRCGTQVLSEADNWYVPERLTPQMNRILETTDTPFGRVVESLEPYRRTFAVKLLWAPLPEGWERDSAPPPSSTDGKLTIPAAVFEHQAVLYTRDGKPFSEVSEVYQRQILAFPPRSPR